MATKTRTTTVTTNPYRKYFVYAPIGAGQLLVEKMRELPTAVSQIAVDPRGKVMKAYDGLAKRGEELVSSIRRSAPTQRAVEQARTARSRVKAATTSVGKAVDATAQATRSAAKKVG
jgi:hypothetical protein